MGITSFVRRHAMHLLFTVSCTGDGLKARPHLWQRQAQPASDASA